MVVSRLAVCSVGLLRIQFPNFGTTRPRLPGNMDRQLPGTYRLTGCRVDGLELGLARAKSVGSVEANFLHERDDLLVFRALRQNPFGYLDIHRVRGCDRDLDGRHAFHLPEGL